MAAPKNNVLGGLTTAGVGTAVIPKLTVPQLPERLTKAFPEMKQFLADWQDAQDKWEVKLGQSVRGKAT